MVVQIITTWPRKWLCGSANQFMNTWVNVVNVPWHHFYCGTLSAGILPSCWVSNLQQEQNTQTRMWVQNLMLKDFEWCNSSNMRLWNPSSSESLCRWRHKNIVDMLDIPGMDTYGLDKLHTCKETLRFMFSKKNSLDKLSWHLRPSHTTHKTAKIFLNKIAVKIVAHI